MIWTRAFWKGLGERAIKTAAQALLAAIGVLGADAAGIVDVGWTGVLSMAALTTLLSILTSIVNADFTAGKPTREPAVEIDLGRRVDLDPPSSL